jgi:hypothetical protein
MATGVETLPQTGGQTRTRSLDATTQAYQILHIAFIVVPTLAGLDKFFHLLANWDGYLAPAFAHLLPFSGHTFMMIVGVVEIMAGLLVAVRPRVGAYVVAAWLAAIIVNLLVLGRYYDVALRDLGLCLAAIALGRLAARQEGLPRRGIAAI